MEDRAAGVDAVRVGKDKGRCEKCDQPIPSWSGCVCYLRPKTKTHFSAHQVRCSILACRYSSIRHNDGDSVC